MFQEVLKKLQEAFNILSMFVFQRKLSTENVALLQASCKVFIFAYQVVQQPINYF